LIKELDMESLMNMILNLVMGLIIPKNNYYYYYYKKSYKI